jgi:hypothetical protein
MKTKTSKLVTDQTIYSQCNGHQFSGRPSETRKLVLGFANPIGGASSPSQPDTTTTTNQWEPSQSAPTSRHHGEDRKKNMSLEYLPGS